MLTFICEKGGGEKRIFNNQVKQGDKRHNKQLHKTLPKKVETSYILEITDRIRWVLLYNFSTVADSWLGNLSV